MKNLKLYSTEAAFNADASVRAAQSGSVLSYITATDRCVSEGKNILRPLSAAEDGMIMVYSKSRGKRYVIAPADIAGTLTDSDLVIGGVTFDCTATDGKITSLVNTDSLIWAQGMKVKLSNFTGDFTLHMKCASNTTTAITNGTIAEIATQIRAIGESSLTVVEGSDYITLEMNYYSTKTIEVTVGTGNVTLTVLAQDAQNVAIDTFMTNVGHSERVGICKQLVVLRKKGISTNYAGANFERFKTFYSTNGVSTQNLSLTSEKILKESAFNATDNAALYNKFGGDYDAYLRSEMVELDTGRLVVGYRKCSAQANALKDLTWTDADGTVKPYFPSVYNQCNYGITTEGYTTGFEAGNWSAMDADICSRLMAGIKTDQTDAVNVALGKISGATKLSVTQSIWTLSLNYSDSADSYYGDGGKLTYLSRYLDFGGRPFSAFSKADD